MNEEPIVPKFGEHLIMVTVHISCKGRGETLGPQARGWVPLTSVFPPGHGGLLALQTGV